MCELIVVIVNSGFEEKVMSAARSVGARGGTIFNARGTAQSQDLVKFMGITLHPNKEIVFILSSKESRDDIMTAIKKETGLATEGAGIIFSLPVDSVMGINFGEPQDTVTPQEQQEASKPTSDEN